MSIRVKAFASLAEKIGFRESSCDYVAGMTIADVWVVTTGNAVRPANALCAVNFDYANWEDAVADGVEVGFFPPVTGG